MKKKNNRNKTQKIYKMKGCSARCSSRKKQLGGNGSQARPNIGANPPQGGNIANSPLRRGGGTHALVGSPWTSNSNWGENNYYPNNSYAPADVSRQIIVAGANPPFSVGGGTKKKNKTNKKRTHQRGGTFSNFMYKDLVNLGRQVSFGMGSTYNALAGYKSPVDPMPWKGQLVNNRYQR